MWLLWLQAFKEDLEPYEDSFELTRQRTPFSPDSESVFEQQLQPAPDPPQKLAAYVKQQPPVFRDIQLLSVRDKIQRKLAKSRNAMVIDIRLAGCVTQLCC